MGGERGGVVAGAARLYAVLLLLLLAGACREATQPIRTVDRPQVSFSPPMRMTFSHGDERRPTWSTDGTTIIYAAEGSAPFPEQEHLLLEVAASRSEAARILFPSVQSTRSQQFRRLSAAAPAADGRIAYVELWTLFTEDVCSAQKAIVYWCSADGAREILHSVPEETHIGELRVRVRQTSSGADPDQEPVVTIPLQDRRSQFVPEGVDDSWMPRFPLRSAPPELLHPDSTLNWAAFMGWLNTRYFEMDFRPFQLVYNQEGSVVVGPSWSPDGERLVFSNGTALVVWGARGEATLDTLPVPGDAAYPAWSPDGRWIAYTRLVPGEAIQAPCTYMFVIHTELRPEPWAPACYVRRTFWHVQARELRMVRPDGTEDHLVATGEMPAWSPDGTLLAFRQEDRIVVGPPGGPYTDLPGSDGGREPAFSPDGTRIVFARKANLETHDLWISTLSQEDR